LRKRYHAEFRVNGSFFLSGFFFVCLLSFVTSAKAKAPKHKKAARHLSTWQMKEEDNVIEQPQALNSFFAVLDSVEKHSLHQAEVLHIGDSHLQADFFPQQVRRRLQLQFGNAGRGLVFPYRAAKTNESFLWQSSARGQFAKRRLVTASDSSHVGLAGMSFSTGDSSATVSMLLNGRDSLDYSFSKMQVLCMNPNRSYNLILPDSGGKALFPECNALNGFCSYTFLPSAKTKNIQLEVLRGEKGKDPFNLHAFILTDTAAGIIYHSVGINGAEYRHYDQSELFFKESAMLNPSLLILSLGTNEAYARNFSADSLVYYADRVISRLLSVHPRAAVLVTSPGDALRARKYKNPANAKAVKALQEYCANKGYAFYNWYRAMGGAGSIKQWFTRGWATKDKLHLTAAGYRLQGEMLYRAIMKARQDKQ